MKANADSLCRIIYDLNYDNLYGIILTEVAAVVFEASS